MMTQQEMHDEFWLLTKSVLQDSKIDAEEARVLKRWLEEHQRETEFSYIITKLDRFLVDGYIDRFESREVIDSLGHTLAKLRPARNVEC